VTEIGRYGVTSPQACRRLRALLIDLEAGVTPGNRPAVRHQLEVLDAHVSRAFDDAEDVAFARAADRQGIGSTGAGATGRHARDRS
jgi:hypothetical protein